MQTHDKFKPNFYFAKKMKMLVLNHKQIVEMVFNI